MTPAQFLGRVKRNEVPPVTLFLGQESYNRRRCREALVTASTVPPETFDAAQTSVAAIIDDARSMSLFASERLIFVSNAEAAMPRTSKSEDDEEGGTSGSAGDAALIVAYAKSPTPGVILVFEATRWDFEGDDKTKNERVRKYYGTIADSVDFRRFTPDEARAELNGIAKAAKVTLEPAAAEALVEALGADVGRIAVELEKLSLYGKPITAEDLPLLVPDARQSTIFALVNALGRRDRSILWTRWCAKANTFRSRSRSWPASSAWLWWRRKLTCAIPSRCRGISRSRACRCGVRAPNKCGIRRRSSRRSNWSAG